MKIKVSNIIFIIFIFLLTGCIPKKQETEIREAMSSKIQEGGEQQMGVLSGKNVLMIIAPKNFRDEEFFKPRVALQAAGAQVAVASKKTEEVTGMLGGKTMPDVSLSEVKVDDYDALVFVGGTGAAVYFEDQQALNLARQAVEQDKAVGAICIAPSILANAGVLKDKKATSFSSERGNLEAKGAEFADESVVADGKIVTATGPEAAEAFGKKLVEVLSLK